MPQEQVLGAIARCLDSGEYTDLTITCGSEVHHVHKMIVCTQSGVLAAAMRFGGTETEQQNINLPTDEPEIVRLLVRYLYTGDYQRTSHEGSLLILYAKMYELAEKYNVMGLKELSRDKFSDVCKHCWGNADFPAAARCVFSTTPEEDKGLRDIVIFTIAKHMELIRKPEIQELMSEFGSLSLEVLLKKADEYEWR